MAQIVCRVCLSTFDDDGDVHPLFDGERNEVSPASLSFKLKYLGFLSVDPDDGLPTHLCGWCATRVEDAYALKRQCNCSTTSLRLQKNTLSLSQESALGPLPRAAEALQDVATLILSSDKRPRQRATAKIASVVLVGAHDMMTSVRNISSALRFNSVLLTNAVHFTENVLSLLTVALHMKEESAALKKSAEAMRGEAESWKRKSAMIDDLYSFLKVLPSTSPPLRRGSHIPSLSPSKALEACLKQSVPLKSATGSHSISREESQAVRSPSPGDVRLTPDSSTSQLTSHVKSEGKHENESLNVICKDSSLHAQSVRRSFRSRATVDHLVYWPSFKKSSRYKESSALHCESTALQCESKNSSHVLDNLLVKRNLSTELGNQIKGSGDRKLSVVPRSKGLKIIKRKKAAEEAGIDCSSSKATVRKTVKKENKLSLSDNSLPRKCSECDKILSCSRSFNAHMMMHMGTSSFPCTYCHKKFTSSWNRVQHERVHTGEKPYVCDICQMSFRYNVTMRLHKSKKHTT